MSNDATEKNIKKVYIKRKEEKRKGKS